MNYPNEAHPNEEELILHYYGEDGDPLAAERHLEECQECRALFQSLQRVLNTVDGMLVPERGGEYGAQVWQRLLPRLPRRRWLWTDLRPAWKWAWAGAAMVALLTIGFFAGRVYPTLGRPAPEVADTRARERVLLVAVGDYLDRSEMVLVELANASGAHSLDISSEQERAEGLISETRLYRQTAATTGNASVTDLLDELERVLLDVARGPSNLSPAQVSALRKRLDAEGVIFKIRVVNSKVRGQQESAAPDTLSQKL
jgi:hypothetical protein